MRPPGTGPGHPRAGRRSVLGAGTSGGAQDRAFAGP